MSACLRCQTGNPPSARFCGACGTALDSACPACGAANPVANRFCHGCGGALPAAPAEAENGGTRPPSPTDGERKQVTVLFADLKGSLELIAGRDPEDARELLDAVVQCMVDAVRELEGTVNHVMGDGIMALFGAPLAQEDHAVRACCAALRMQENVASLRPEFERRLATEPRLRVGLNSGEVVVRSFASDVHEDYSAIGPATHLAARMEQISEPGKILITEETWKLTRSFVHTVPRGEVTVKGLSHPTRVFELVGVTRTRLRFEASRARGLTPLVGRQAELAALRRAIEAAPHGQVVAVVGDPGVGKSRLVWELGLALAPGGWLVLFESAQAHARGSPYGVFRDLLRRYFGHPDDADPAALAREVSARLGALDPALADCAPALLGLLVPARRDHHPEGVAPETRRRQTIDGLRRLLLRESHRQPVLLVVEDAQWIDPETRAVLDALVEALPAGRLTLLVTCRPEFRHDWASLSYYTQLRVLPLPPATARELLEALLGQDAALEPVIDLLLSHAEGNPFFLEERVWALVDAGTLVGARGAYRVAGPVTAVDVPATVQALLASRIDRLQPDEKALLQAAAVIGREVPLPLLRAVTGWPEARTRLVLSRLEGAEFVYQSGLFPEIVHTFRHALTHEVAYGSLLHRRRREMHAAVLAALERGEGGRLSTPVERVAEHAVRGEVWPRAVHFLRLAGAQAAADSAHRLAAGWFDRALLALARLPASREHTEEAIDLRLDLRYALSPLGDFPRVLECLREAERLARELGDQRRLGRITSYLANYHQVVGELETAVRYGQQALDAAAQEGDLATQVVARSFVSLAYQTLGDYPRAIALARENLTALPSASQHDRFGMALLPAVYSRTSLVRALAEVGGFPEALRVAGEAVAIAEEARHGYSLMFALLGSGVALLRRGSAAEAVPVLERSLELCRKGASPTMTALVGAFLGSAYAGTGRLGPAAAVLDEADRQAGAIGLGESTLPRALILVARGEAHHRAAEAAEALGTAGRAREAFRKMGARGYEAWALWLMAVARDAAALDGSRAEREAGFREALAAAQALGMEPLVARCQVGLGEFLDREGRDEEAREWRGRGGETLRRLGMAPGPGPGAPTAQPS